jgi:hypothetical protein
MANADSVREEAAPYRALSASERLALGAAASRSTLEVVRTSTHGQRALSYRDPLPNSTLRALERLRAEYRAKRGDGRS